MDAPVRFAQNGDIHLAYKVIGDGDLDLVFVPTWLSNLDFLDRYKPLVEAIEGLASFARVIILDRRGTGLSDRLCGVATLEEGMDDLTAVLDAAGAEKVSLLTFNESGTLGALYAATHPARVRSLILYGTFATTTWQPDYPWGQKPEDRDQQIALVTQLWGDEATGAMFNAGPGADEEFQRWAVRWARNSVSRDALPGVFEMLAKTDVRHVLPTIRVPTLVLHRSGDALVPVENGRYLAKNIPNAKYVELPGEDHLPFLGDRESIADEIEEFITGSRRARGLERVLATILFTDIVGSTEKAVAMGDERWRRVLDEYDEIVRLHLDRFQGKLVKNLGDGHFATFDGPARALRCACSIRTSVKKLGIDLRSGLHTGEVEVRGNDLGGIAVHIGARVMSLAQPGEVLVSSAVPPLVAGSGIDFEDCGMHELRGVEGKWAIYRVEL
ncbi:MAG: adenylate/guanylate cyclase domain-containing protein [Actinomycetota bacterium]|nr:adenylate/guanylate cyclase domain-containing protein [Actinomycetota bacterium]